MSAENAQLLDRTNYLHEVYTLQQDIDVCQQNILNGLSVLINDNIVSTQVQELVLNEQQLNTLTAITLPDGTQAFITQDPSDYEPQKEEATLNIENGAILLGDIEDVDSTNIVQLQLDALDDSSLQNDNSVSSDTENMYTELQVINGVVYLVTNQNEEISESKESSEVKPKKDEILCADNQNENDSTKSNHNFSGDESAKTFDINDFLQIRENTKRPYKCTDPKCRKSFSTGYSLKAHQRIHTGEKPYKCSMEDCDKGFKTSGDLLKHVRTHTGERPFVCPFEGCGRSFTTSNIRKVHIRTHTGERPFKCTYPMCEKAFASSTNYKNHVRIHSGEKPYVCTIKNCGRRFTEYSSLYKHHLVHNQEKSHECDICHKQYRQQSTLLMHKKTAHAILYNDQDEILDVLLENSVDLIDEAKRIAEIKKQQIQLLNCDAIDEDQIFLLEDPSQLVTLQTLESLNDDSSDSPIDIALEEINLKHDGVELRWN